MGFFIGLVRWIVKTLFVLAIAVFLLLSIGAHFSEKENLKPLIQEVAISQVGEQQISELKDSLNSACIQQGEDYIEQYNEQANKTLRIDCKNITNEYVKELFKEQVVGTMFENLYLQKCEGVQCIMTNPMAVASESGNKIINTFRTISIVAILIFALLLVLMTPKISGKLFAIGSPVLVTGIPYLFMDFIKTNIMANIPAEASALGAVIADKILAYVSSQFLIMLIIGAVLIVAGFIVKFTLEKGKKEEKIKKK